ncbi:MAG: sugar phosphate isomerase/epimerase [Lachnospiraceae bacterium]|nr:sugar phosphate isomerase/epimerase [Lachnospiraceae bacterium]
MSKILISTGALIGRPNQRNLHLLEEIFPRLSCDGLEFMFYSDWYETWEETADYLKSTGYPFPTMHCQKTVGELITKHDDETALYHFEINCKVAQRIGAKKLVMHLWNGVISDSDYPHSLEIYKHLRKIADDNGIDLLIENVLCNQKDPMTRWVELLEKYPDAHFVFDTKMADFHRQLELIYEDRYSYMIPNIHHYHVNDYGGGYLDWSNLKVLPVGAGHIDFKRFFEFVKETGYDDTYTVEATAFLPDGKIDYEMLNTCFENVRHYLEMN